MSHPSCLLTGVICASTSKTVVGRTPVSWLLTQIGVVIAAIPQVGERLADPVDVGFNLWVCVHVILDVAADLLVRQPTKAGEEVVHVWVAEHIVRHRGSDRARRLGQVGGRAASRGRR